MATAKPKRRLTRVSGKLKGVAEAKADPSILLADIKKHVHAKAMADDRNQKVIHPSEMAKADWCPRQTFLRIRHYTANPDQPLSSGRSYSFQMQNIFEEGHEVHRKYQGWLAEMGRLYGKWFNILTGQTLFEHTLSAEEYATGQWVYREVPLYDDEFGISGSGDGAVLDLSSLLEIKTIGMGTLRWEEPTWLSRFLVKTEDGKSIYDLDDAWKNIKRPLASHLKQTNIYLWLGKRLDIPIDRTLFIYEYKANQGVKEFSVKYSERLIEDLLDKAWDVTNRLRTEAGPPPIPEHAGKDVSVCKECPFHSECWSSDASSEEESGRDAGTGRSKPRRKAPSRTTGSARSGEAGGVDPGGARRPRRPARRRPDGAVQQDHQVGQLPWRPVGSGGD